MSCHCGRESIQKRGGREPANANNPPPRDQGPDRQQTGGQPHDEPRRRDVARTALWFIAGLAGGGSATMLAILIGGA